MAVSCPDGTLLAQMHLQRSWLVWFGGSTTAATTLYQALRLARREGSAAEKITSADGVVCIELSQIERLVVQISRVA